MIDLTDQEFKEIVGLLNALAETLGTYTSLELTNEHGVYALLAAHNRGYLSEPDPSKKALKEYCISKKGLAFLKEYRKEQAELRTQN